MFHKKVAAELRKRGYDVTDSEIVNATGAGVIGQGPITVKEAADILERLMKKGKTKL